MHISERIFGTRQVYADPLHMVRQIAQAQTEAEALLIVGRLFRFFVRHGLLLEVIAEELRVPVFECWLMVQFSQTANSLKLQAMLEDWPWEKIRSQLLESERVAS